MKRTFSSMHGLLISLVLQFFLVGNASVGAQNSILNVMGVTLQQTASFLTHNSALKLGYGYGPEDRRLFDYRFRTEISTFDAKSNDFEFMAAWQKPIVKSRFLDIDCGLQITSTNTTFGRPVKQSELGDMRRDLRVIGRYTINKASPALSSRLYLLGKKYRVFLSFDAVPAFDFRKKLKSGDFHVLYASKWSFQFNSLELYSGFGVRVGKNLLFQFAYRTYYVYRVDKVLFNDILFNGVPSPFLEMKYDHYTLPKYMLTVGYLLPSKKPTF